MFVHVIAIRRLMKERKKKRKEKKKKRKKNRQNIPCIQPINKVT